MPWHRGTLPAGLTESRSRTCSGSCSGKAAGVGFKPAGFWPELALALLWECAALPQPCPAPPAPVAFPSSAWHGLPAASSPSDCSYCCIAAARPRQPPSLARTEDHFISKHCFWRIASPNAESLLCLQAGWHPEGSSAAGLFGGRDPVPSLGRVPPCLPFTCLLSPLAAATKRVLKTQGQHSRSPGWCGKAAVSPHLGMGAVVPAGPSAQGCPRGRDGGSHTAQGPPG